MKNITTQEAAAIIGKSPQFVRVAMQQGVLKIGECFKLKKGASQYSYSISPALLAQRQGLTVPELYAELERIRQCS